MGGILRIRMLTRDQFAKNLRERKWRRGVKEAREGREIIWQREVG